MKRGIAAGLLLLMIVSVAAPAIARNPFTSEPGKQPAPSYGVKSDFFDRISIWQQKLNAEMTSLVREAEATRSIKPLLLLIVTAFAYGLIHAAGPGHGKVIALSYVLTQKPSYVRGMLFGSSIGLLHGFSGIVFVLIIRFILKTNFIKSLETVTSMTQMICYALIACLGLGIFVHGMYALLRKNGGNTRTEAAAGARKCAGSLWPALVVGVIPCPGVAMVMLFTLSINLVSLGVIMGLAISLGMALTISLVVLTAVTGKAASLGALSKRLDRMVLADQVIRAVAGFLLMMIGAFFLAALLR